MLVRAVDPELNEAVMVTVNSVNSCPYCEGLHGSWRVWLGGQPRSVDARQNIVRVHKVVDTTIVYARTFADTMGEGMRKPVHLMCWRNKPLRDLQVRFVRCVGFCFGEASVEIPSMVFLRG